MNYQSLTSKQRKVLAFIREKLRADGYPPTIREIGSRFGFRSTGTVRDYLWALEKKGFLKRRGRKARGIELSFQLTHREIPILGRVAAGTPTLAEENLEGYLDVEETFRLGKGTHFALRVQGDSMIGAGILEEDLVVVRSQKTAQPSDIVVAMVEGEVTVKRLQRKADSASSGRIAPPDGHNEIDGEHRTELLLVAENPAYSPIPVTENTRILGKVAMVVRNV